MKQLPSIRQHLQNRLHQSFDYLVYFTVRLVVAITGIFSHHTHRTIVAFISFVVTHIIPFRRKILLENLSQAFPEKSSAEKTQIIEQMWNHLLLMGVEFIIGRRVINELNWRKHIDIADGANNVQVFFPDRPLIVVTGHYGNFEMGGYVLGLLGYPTHTVARLLDNHFLNRYIQQLRESTGQYIIDKVGASNTVATIMEERGIVAFLADHSAGRKGRWVNFFGKPASTHKVIALLSLEYKAPILVCHCTRVHNEELHFELVADDFYDPLQPKRGIHTAPQITQWFTSAIEKAVRRHPEQYWWLHRRWKDYGEQHTVSKAVAPDEE